jgi:hypothetical protein
MATIGSLVVDLTANSAQFNAGLAKADRTLKSTSARMNRSLATVDRRFQKLGRATSSWAKSLVSLRGAVGVLAGATGLGLLISKSIDFADTIAKTADAIGVSTDALQQYRFAADIAGVEQEKLDKSLTRFVRNMGELARSSSETQTALKDLDPVLLSNLRNANSIEEALRLTFRALANTGDQAKKAAIAYAIFGRSGIAMTNIVKDGSTALEEQLQKARDLGIVIDEELLRSAERAKDQFTILATVIKAQATKAVLEHAGEIANLTQKLIDGIPKIIRWTEEFAKWIGLIDETPAEKLREITSEIDTLQRRLATLRANPSRGDIGIAASIEREIAALKAEREGLRAEVARREREAQAGAASTGGKPAPGPLRVTIPPSTDPRIVAGNAAIDAHMKLLDRLEARGREVFAATRTPLEQYNARLEELNKLLEAGAIDQDTYGRAVKQAQENLDRQGSTIDGVTAKIDLQKNAFNNLGGVLDQVLDGQIKSWEDFGQVAVGVLRNILSELFRVGGAQNDIFGGGGGGLLKGVSGLFGLFGGSGGGGAVGSPGVDPFALGGVVARAHGGPLSALQPALVGERGPELFVPASSGTVVPNRALSGGGTVTVVQNITVNAGVAPTVRAEMMAMLPRFRQEAVGAVVEARRRKPGLFGFE